jgi:hypothetical protein
MAAGSSRLHGRTAETANRKRASAGGIKSSADVQPINTKLWIMMPSTFSPVAQATVGRAS